MLGVEHMTELFSHVPLELFRPLSAQGASLYASALLTIFELTRRYSQPLSRELAMHGLMELLQDRVTDGLDELNVQEDDDTDPLRAKASALLRYLERCGWLRSETQADFSRSLTLPEYAFRLLQVLAELGTGERRGLKGRVFAIFDLLKAAAQQGEAQYRIPEAHKLTEELMVSLKELQHNIGQFVQRMLVEQRVSDVLAQFFGEYQRLLEERYRPLRTDDHVSKFRPGVLEALDAIEQTLDDRLLDQSNRIREAFMAMDDILENLDSRNRQYTSAAVRKLELYLTQSTTTSGRLHALLEASSPDIEDVFQFQRLRFLAHESLFKPRRLTDDFLPESSPTTESPQELDEARQRTLVALRLALRYGPEAVRQKLVTWLGDEAQRRASELPLDTEDGILTLIFARKHRSQLGLQLEDLDEWVRHGNYAFRNAWIARAGEKLEPSDVLRGEL